MKSLSAPASTGPHPCTTTLDCALGSVDLAPVQGPARATLVVAVAVLVEEVHLGSIGLLPSGLGAIAAMPLLGATLAPGGLAVGLPVAAPALPAHLVGGRVLLGGLPVDRLGRHRPTLRPAPGLLLLCRVCLLPVSCYVLYVLAVLAIVCS